MRDALLLGAGRWLLPIPAFVWRRKARREAQRIAAGLGWMTVDHHRVRDFVVRELACTGRPVSSSAIAQALGFETHHVVRLLDELERRLTFVFRGSEGAVSWAYPFTANATPHQVAFPSGERVNAA
ncbi:MAG TPA: hypothetical protein VMK12_13020 [Anaeromyxobacteraceae bacterium]|nr:hypothetical protein [Anaeromyxobacteraceae bacterium]